MVFLTSGTRCAICGETISPEPAAALRPFVRNRKDPLFVLSGRAFHKRCLDTHPLRDRALEAVRQRNQQVNSATCVVCGRRIEGSSQTTDLLSSEQSSPLFRFNYFFFHEHHLPSWDQLEEFREIVARAEQDNLWEGEPLVRVLL